MDRKIYDNYVFAVAEHGSLTKAATSLGVTQPALSSGLNTLEKDIGFKIFDRQTSPIAFTIEGQLYFDYINKVHILENDLNKRIDCVRCEANSKVVIGGPVAYAESLVAGAVHELLTKHPNYHVSVKSAPLDELVSMSSSGEIDCFISTSSKLPDNLESKLIKKEKIYLCVPKGYVVNKQLSELKKSDADSFDFSVLSNQDFVFLEDPQPLQQSVNQFLSKHNVCANSRITVNQVSTALSFSIKGEGICFVTEEALAGNADLKDVVVYDLPNSLSGREIFISYDKNLVMTEACQNLVQIFNPIV